MGNRFDISVVDNSEVEANKAIEIAIEEIERIEKLISSWDPESQTSVINNNAGLQPVKVDPELLNLISRSAKISEITQGAFDISFGSIDKGLWKFDGSITKMPDAVAAAEAVKLINYRNIQIDPLSGTVFLKQKGMRIGFGAIGKGYAAEMAKKKLLTIGVEAGVINASGDMTIWGRHPEHDYWTVGIADPEAKQQVFSSLKIKDQAVVTSGNYEKFVMIDGKKYSHIIDPRTGYPAAGLKSVTVIAANAELADALATAIFILGKDVGLDLVNQLEKVNCVIINDENKIFYSDGININ
jgi:thiamine biosynthesis lipoprotein